MPCCPFPASPHFMISEEDCKENVELKPLGENRYNNLFLACSQTPGHVNRQGQVLNSKTPTTRCLLLVWVIPKKLTREIQFPQVGVQIQQSGNIMIGQRPTSVDNRCIIMRKMTVLTNDETVMKKWRGWRMKKSHDENEDVDEWRFHEEIVNDHEWDFAMTYFTERWKASMLD